MARGDGTRADGVARGLAIAACLGLSACATDGQNTLSTKVIPDSTVELARLYGETILSPITDESADRLWTALDQHDQCFGDPRQCTIDEADFTRDELKTFLEGRHQRLIGLRHANKSGAGIELAANEQKGTLDIWPREFRKQDKLTYAIDQRTLAPAHYLKIVEFMTNATRVWENECSALCELDFVHKQEHDANPDGADLVFVVRDINHRDEIGGDIARSDWPHDYSGKPLRIRIDEASFFRDGLEHRKYTVKTGNDKSFDTTISLEGILRHELGHFLGYRHEFILFQGKGVVGQCVRTESEQSEAVFARVETLLEQEWLQGLESQTDPDSVMMYPCSDKHVREKPNPVEFKLSDRDKLIHKDVYANN